MNLLIGFAARAGLRVAEIGYLAILFAGVWLAAAQVPQLKLHRTRTLVAGIALAIGGGLLIIAVHWGHFG